MAAIADADVSIDSSGNIRWTGAATTNRHTVLEFIQWLMDKQDDQQAAGDDLLDITVDTPFSRSTDQIVTLNAPFNIDDTFALHLYDGSVSQTNPIHGGEDLWSGLGVIGPVETGTEYMIIQNGKVLPAFWGTGINPEAAPSLVFSRHLVKSKEAGSEIDGQKILVLAREFGDQYRRFPVTLGTGNAVAAIGNGDDIFNENTDATVGAWTITNTEGFQEINIDGSGAGGQEYYSQWDINAQTINDTYEYTKWISQRSHQADVTGGTPTGTDFVIENGTIDGQAQSFIPRSTTELLTEARAKIKILAGSPTGKIYAELYDSDDAASQLAEPTGALLARSEDVLASHITSSYEEVIFRFNRFNPATGADQIDGLRLVNAEYFIVFRHDEADGSNNFSLEGAATDQDATMNQADSTAATWTASATDDIYLETFSSPVIHGVQGELFQGINVEVGFSGEAGAGVLETEATNDELAIWGTKVTYDDLDDNGGNGFKPGELVTFNTPGNSHTGTADLSFSATGNTITRGTGSWVTDGFTDGTRIRVKGSTSNDGIFYIISVDSATVMTVQATLTTESNTSATVTNMTAIVSGGVILYDDGVDEIVVALDSPGASVLTDNDVICTARGTVSGETTALIATTIVADDLTGGTGWVLAKDDNGTSGEFYLQVVSGENPVNTNRIYSMAGTTLSDYADATATINTRTVNPEFVGTSTGSNIIGSYGIGFDPNDVGSSDLFRSLDNSTRTPPNNVQFTVSGLVSGQDRVLVGPRTGTALDRGQWLVSTALDDGIAVAPETALVVKTGTDTVPFVAAREIWPASGTGSDVSRLRIEDDDGIYRRVPFDSDNSTDTFTLGTPVSGSINCEVTAGLVFERQAGNFLTDGFEPGCVFTTTGFTNGGNNSQFVATTVTATQITVSSTTGMVTETGGGGNETFTGDGWEFNNGDSSTFANASVNNDVFMAYIDVLASADTASFTGVHDGTDIDLFVRVRDGGGTPIKTFESTSAQFKSTAQTIAAVRTSDV